jgi:hypothetical protein
MQLDTKAIFDSASSCLFFLSFFLSFFLIYLQQAPTLQYLCAIEKDKAL